ncbi:MAG: hypothetical protein Q8P76_00230 [bacterium]|nr:hypothetical protein [bacterium]
MNEGIFTYTKAHLAVLFEEQLAILQAASTQIVTISALLKQKEAVIAKASEMIFAESYIPFIPVIPREWRTPLDQVVFLHEENKGFCRIESQDIWNNQEMPQKPYYIFNVEDGAALRRENPNAHEHHLDESGRRFLTAEEIINLALQGEVLRRHWLVAPASGCQALADDGSIVKGWPFLVRGSHSVIMQCVHPSNLQKMASRFSYDWGVPTCFKESYNSNITPAAD